MSLNGINQPFFPLTIDGTSTINTDAIYIDGALFTPSNYVPYTGATQTIDANSQNIKTTHYATANSDVVNVQVLNDAISGVYPIVGANFLNKLITTPQTVAGPVEYDNTLTSASSLIASTNTYANLADQVLVSTNYVRSTNDASWLSGSNMGTISSAGGVYQATSTANFSTLYYSSVPTGVKMSFYIEVKISDPSYASNISLYASSNGVSLNQALGPSVQFFPGDNVFKVLSGDVIPNYSNIMMLISTARPSGIQTIFWQSTLTSGMGVSLKNLTLSDQTASTVPVLNAYKQLVSSIITAAELGYLSGTTSSIQTQLNNLSSSLATKLNLSGSNANQNIVLGAYKVQSSATPTTGNDYTNKTYVDTAISGAGALYLLKAGDTATGTIFNSGGNFHAYRGGDTNRCCILYANNADGATYASHNGGLASWYGIGFTSTLDNTTRFIFNTRDGSSSQTGTLTANAVNIDGQTASRVCVFDASKNVVSSSVSSTTLTYLDIGSSLTGLLATKANLAGSNTFSGTNTFSSATPITLSGLTASRALALNASGNIVVSTTTSTELGYLSGTTSSVQTQLNTLSGTFANYLPLTGGTLTGLLKITPTSTGNRKLVLYDSGLNNDYQYYGLGINDNTLRFNIPVASTDRFSFFAGTGTTSAIEVFRVNGTGGLESGVSGASPNTTANLKMSSSASHIDNNAGEVYLFTGYNGHLGVQRNTTRNATTACLALGTADTEQSEIISYKADGSAGYMPLAYAGSVHAWVSGNSTDTTLTSYSMLGQTGFDGSNLVNLQCQASQYGRNQLIMTGRYEASNDAWAFSTPRNAIRFRTQSSLNSAYTNRWTIQNFADKLGFLSSSGGNTPRVVFTDGGLVGIGTDSPSTLLELIGSTTSFSVKDPTATSYSAMRLGNDSGYGCYWFLNGSSRSADGGVNTATLRNDLGDLRLHSAGGYGFTIDRLSGYTRQYGGDNSKILFGPNTTWSSYLVVGAGTNEVAANKAQIISTNSNLHFDAGLGKDTYINFYQGAPSQGNQPGSIYSYGLNWTHNGALTIGNAPSGYDRIVWSRTSNQPNIQMGDNFLSYASTNGSWTSDAIAGDMILRTGGSTIRLNTNGGGSSAFWASSTYVVINAGWKFSVGATGAQTIMGVGGGSTSGNVLNTGAWPNNANGMLISDSNNQNANTGGLFLGYGVDTGIINCLAPSVAWKYLYIYSGGMGIGWYGSMVAYTGPGGWTNISDEREKEDIQDLKTSSSLRRVLSLKPKHYLRKYYDQTNPMPEELKTQRCVGFLAQEVQQSNPHCVSQWENKEAKTEEDDGKRLGMSYNDYIVHLVGAVQEQQKMINEQQKTINLLSERNQLLEKHANATSDAMNALNNQFEEYRKQTDERFNKLVQLLTTTR